MRRPLNYSPTLWWRLGQPLETEIMLGIGGMLALKKLGIKNKSTTATKVAALINVQRLIDLINEGSSFNEALEVVRASSLYTVHTPVPAGHDML